MMTRESRFDSASERVPTFLCGVCELDGFSENYPSAEARQAHWTESGHGPVQEYLAANTVKRTFPGATEMTEADKAEAVRMAPEYRAPGTKLRGRQYGSDRPATRPDNVRDCSIKQARYVVSLIRARMGNPAIESIREALADSWVERGSRKFATGEKIVAFSVARSSIDALTKIDPAKTGENATSTVQEAPSAPQNPSKTIRRTNKFAGKCGSCGQKVEPGEGIWQLDDQGESGVFHLDGECPLSDLGIPTGRYAVEHEGVLKFYVIKPNGLFVMASDEEHRITKKDRQVEIAELIKVDPMGAMRRYGHEIGRCGRCGRTLTDEDSRANGIGPICMSKAFG